LSFACLRERPVIRIRPSAIRIPSGIERSHDIGGAAHPDPRGLIRKPFELDAIGRVINPSCTFESHPAERLVEVVADIPVRLLAQQFPAVLLLKIATISNSASLKRLITFPELVSEDDVATPEHSRSECRNDRDYRTRVHAALLSEVGSRAAAIEQSQRRSCHVRPVPPRSSSWTLSRDPVELTGRHLEA